MKRKYKVRTGKKTVEREYSYIPVRYIIAVLITLLEILAIIGIVVACCYYIEETVACLCREVPKPLSADRR